MKNTIKKPKIYFLIALLVAIVSLLIITVFIIQAIRIEWENSIIAVLFLLLFFLSIYSIYLNLFSLSIHKSANAGISRIYGLFFTFQ